MFKKLRNTFLKTNAMIIGLLLIICFTIIFIIVYGNVQNTISERLQLEISMHLGPGSRSGEGRERRGDEEPGTDSETPPERPNSSMKPAANGEAPKEKPNGENAPLADGTAPKDLPNDDTNPAANGETPPAMPDEEELIDDMNGLESDTSFSPSFSIQTDADGNVEAVNIVNGVTYDFYEGITAELIEKKTGQLSFTDDGTSSLWSYRAHETSSGYIIAFMETSMEANVLRTLLICLVLITLLSIAAIILISYYIANRAIAPIELAYNKQKQFIADASHELKTPLTTISANIDVLLSHEDSTITEEKKWLIYLQDEAKRMSALTNSLLYLAKADYNEEKIVYSRVSFTDAVKNTLLATEARVFESGQTLSTDIDDDIYVLGSDEHLKSLVLILIDNAIKYTPENGEITVSLKKSSKSSNAVMMVRNTGVGISEEDMKHIFDRFYRSDKARTHTEQSGFGLGLAIAQTLTKNLKGSISVSSQPNEYTEFKVKLPLAK